MGYEDKIVNKHGEPTLPEDSEQLDILDALYATISAINNKKRLKILFTIANENKKNNSADLYASEIRRILYKNGLKISETAVGDFLKQLVAVDLLKKEKIKISGKSPLDVFKINPMGFNRIFLELENLRQDLIDWTYDFEKDGFDRENQCKITVINGVDGGKSFLLNCDDGEVKIGRFGQVSIDDPDYEKDIKLSNEYEAVTKVSKPHASLKFQRGKWFIYDGDNINGIYINNMALKVSNTQLHNKDLIKLAQGDKGVALLCSLN